MPHLRLFLCAAFLLGAVPAFTQDDEIPETMWELRDKYNFDGPIADIGYAVDYGDWRILTPTLGEVFSNISWQITLADGTVLKPREFGKASTTRDRMENAIGAGTVFLTLCPVKNGLKVTHKMATYANRSGVTVHLEVQNVGDAPVQIKTLEPMVAVPGEIKQVKLESDGDGGPFVFANASENIAVLLGTIPLGGAATKLSFNDESGVITGGSTSTAGSPMTLAPGERIETDPFMIVFAYGDPAKAREFFGYAYSDAVGTPPAASAPAAATPAGNGPATEPEADSDAQPKGRLRRFFGR